MVHDLVENHNSIYDLVEFNVTICVFFPRNLDEILYISVPKTLYKGKEHLVEINNIIQYFYKSVNPPYSEKFQILILDKLRSLCYAR